MVFGLPRQILDWQNWRQPLVVIDPRAGVAEDVDGRKSLLEPLTQRAKHPSVGGKMVIHSSSGGLPRTAPEGWPPRAIAELKVGPA